MIRTHIRIAHIASIRIGSPVDSPQCDWGIIYIIQVFNVLNLVNCFCTPSCKWLSAVIFSLMSFSMVCLLVIIAVCWRQRGQGQTPIVSLVLSLTVKMMPHSTLRTLEHLSLRL